MLLFSLFAGVYVDRFPKKKMLLITQIVQMLQAIMLAMLVWFGIVKYWHVFILAGILGLANTFDMPTRQSFFIELVGRENLKNAIGLNSTIVNIARIIGPGLAGIIMARYGIAFCFLMNGLSFLAVVFSLIKIKSYAVNIRVKQQKLKEEIFDGLRYIKSQKQILYAVLAMLAMGTFAMNTNVIIPVFARVVLNQGAQGYSFLLSAMGVGSLIGSLYFAARSREEVSHDGILIYAIALSFCLLLAGMAKNYNLLLIIIAVLGFFNLLFMTTINSTMQMNTDNEHRGRVMSIYSLVFTGTTPIGNFLTGYVAQNYGSRNSFFFCGVVSMFFMLGIYALFKLSRGKVRGLN